jgi:hypothetical protein
VKKDKYREIAKSERKKPFGKRGLARLISLPDSPPLDSRDRRAAVLEPIELRAQPVTGASWRDVVRDGDCSPPRRPYGLHTARHLPELKTPAVST